MLLGCSIIQSHQGGRPELQRGVRKPLGEDKYVVGGKDMSVRQYEYASGHELDCNQKHHGPVHTGFEFREA